MPLSKARWLQGLSKAHRPRPVLCSGSHRWLKQCLFVAWRRSRSAGPRPLTRTRTWLSGDHARRCQVSGGQVSVFRQCSQRHWCFGEASEIRKFFWNEAKPLSAYIAHLWLGKLWLILASWYRRNAESLLFLEKIWKVDLKHPFWRASSLVFPLACEGEK